MKNFKITTGELKHKIFIQRATKIKNDDGLIVESWKEILRCKAKIVNKSGKEIQIASGTATNITTRFYIRYSRGLNLTTKDRIEFNNKIFNIVYASNILENNQWYEIIGEYNG